MHQPLVRAALLPGSQQRQLLAQTPILCGQCVIAEEPLLSVDVTPRYAYGSYAWDMVSLLLDQPDLFKRFRTHKLSRTTQLLDPESLQVEAHLVHKHRKSRQLVRELYEVVGTNNIGILTPEQGVRGHGVFPLLSRANHSCEPSCSLQAAPGDGNAMTLVAKHDLRPGDAITWSYFREAEFLPATFDQRNRELVNLFRFACWCGRCRRERPDALSGVKDLVAHYDDQILEKAKLLASSTMHC